MMASPGGAELTPAEQKELDKFTKYLSMKAVQVIIQSRLGERMAAASNPDTTTGTTWFNLAVKDSSEVQSETRRSLSGSVPSPGLPLGRAQPGFIEHLNNVAVTVSQISTYLQYQYPQYLHINIYISTPGGGECLLQLQAGGRGGPPAPARPSSSPRCAAC